MDEVQAYRPEWEPGPDWGRLMPLRLGGLSSPRPLPEAAAALRLAMSKTLLAIACLAVRPAAAFSRPCEHDAFRKLFEQEEGSRSVFYHSDESLNIEGTLVILILSFLFGTALGVLALLMCSGPCIRTLKYGAHRFRRWHLRNMVPRLHRVAIGMDQLPTEEQVCIVCLGALRDEVMEANGLLLLPCRHAFHYDCVYAWFEQSLACPSCRSAVRNFESSFHAILLPHASSVPPQGPRCRKVPCQHPLCYGCLANGRCMLNIYGDGGRAVALDVDDAMSEVDRGSACRWLAVVLRFCRRRGAVDCQGENRKGTRRDRVHPTPRRQ